MSVIWVILIVLGAIIFVSIAYVIGVYNKLIVKKNYVDSKWSGIDVELKRRADLIPNLVETVKGYASHEKETLDAVISARTKFTNASTVGEKIESSNMMTNALGKLMAIAEAYPDLKANTNFLELQSELSNTEDKISDSRESYNNSVKTYNNLSKVFPSNVVANMFGFEKFEYFEALETEKETPKVEF